MKRLLVALIVLVIASAFAKAALLLPENLTLTLARIQDEGSLNQYIFVINGIAAYKTLAGLENYLKILPKNSTLTYAPGCCRFGSEPLGSETEMKKFREYCDSVGVKLVVVPSG